jgi:hemoglobin
MKHPKFDCERSVSDYLPTYKHSGLGGCTEQRNLLFCSLIAPLGKAVGQRDRLQKEVEAMQPQDTPSLYDRLGGVYNIATAIDDFIDRVMNDPRLNANPRVDEAHHRVSPAGFKYLVTEQLCEAAGGPQRYSGRTMGDTHRNLMITEEEWEAFMDDLQQTFDKFEVPQPEQDELKAIVESTKEAIVVEPLQEGPVEVS